MTDNQEMQSILAQHAERIIANHTYTLDQLKLLREDMVEMKAAAEQHSVDLTPFESRLLDFELRLDRFASIDRYQLNDAAIRKAVRAILAEEK